MSFQIMDGHQDLLDHLRKKPKVYQTSPRQLDRSQVRALFASIFTDDPNERKKCGYVERDIHAYQHLTYTHPTLVLIKTFGDFDRVMHQGDQTGLVLHLEGLCCLNQDNWQDQLVIWRMYGVLSAGIVGNESNRLGGGCKDYGRLTPLGRDVIHWMNRNQMIVDLAHANPETFFDIINVVTKPPVISHGNARAKSNRRRNYTNDQLRILADHGGLIGISLVPGFVLKNRLPNLDDFADHIMYVIDLIGLQHVALGSDFGGIESKQLIPRASRVEELDLLLYTLERRGLREHELDLIACGNWERVLRANLL